MGWDVPIRKVAINAGVVRDNIAQVARFHFDPMLAAIGLSKEQIINQDLDELKESLERVNEALENPESFSLLRIQITAEGEAVLNSSNYSFEIGIVPTLLDRKKLILERIRFLTSDEKIGTIHDLVDQVKDEDIRTKIEEELGTLKSENRQIQKQQRDLNEDETREYQKTQSELAKLSVELFERRSKVWFSLLERESAATIIGGLILMVIVGAHVVAIFTRIPISEILNNAFLIILGYFFGQSTNQSSSK